MAVAPFAAAQAYAAVQSQATSALSGAAAAKEAGAAGFSAMLRQVMTDTVQASRAAETQMAAQMQGKAELIDVVTAISSAEASLETVIAVRDQVIQAYQEIMRMPI